MAKNPDMIKANLLKVGDVCYMTMYSLPENYEKVEIVARPDCTLNNMKNSDKFIVKILETNEIIEFKRNTAKPHFLVTSIPGTKEGTTKLDRVRFWIPNRSTNQTTMEQSSEQ